MKQAVEIILTLSTAFKASADQQSVDAQTDISLSLDLTNYFFKYFMTLPEGQTQVIAHDQSISFIRCLFSLVQCKV